MGQEEQWGYKTMRKKYLISLNDANSDIGLIKELDDTKVQLEEMLEINKSPDVCLEAAMPWDLEQPITAIEYNRKAIITLTNNRYNVFNLASTMYKAKLYESEEINNMTQADVACDALSFAIAFCEVKGLNTNLRNESIYLPAEFKDDLLPKCIFSEVDDYNVPLTLREKAEYFKKKYDMRVAPLYD